MKTWRKSWQALQQGRGAGEDGNTLIFALIMIFVVGLLATSVMGYVGTSLNTSAKLRTSAKTLYSADGAVDAAIQNIRNNPALGYTDLPTPSTSAQACSFLVTVPGQPPADVACTPTTVSSHAGSGGTGDTNPGSAVLTLGQRASEPGRTTDFWSGLFPCFGTYAYNWQHAANCGGFNWIVPVWWGGDPNAPPPWGNIPEPGVMFQASGEKQGQNTGPVNVQGPIYDNSTVASYSQFNIADQVDANGQSGINVRQPCAPSGGGTIGVDTSVPPNGTIDKGCDVTAGGYASVDPRFNDPGFQHRGQRPGEPFPTLIAVGSADWPVCAASTLVKFKPGFYNDAAALDTLFESAACNGKDFWFMPGFYYFDFRNTSPIPARCDNSGNKQSSDPAVYTTDPNNALAYGSMHEWCIRASSKGGTNRPHIVGGTPMGLNWANLDALPKVLQAANVASTDFSPTANAQDGINGTTATTNWSSNTANQNPNGVVSSQVGTPGVDDFGNKNNATGAIDNTVASAALASTPTPMTASSSISTQLVSGVDDFGTPANGKVIDNTPTSSALTSVSQPQTATGVPESSTVTGAADFANLSQAIGIDGASATHTLASGSTTMVPTSASSSQTVPGTDDFGTPANGKVIDGTATRATVTASTTTTLKPARNVASGSAFSPTGNALAIDGSFASYTSNCPISCDAGQITLQGYPPIPANATPTSATITVKHYEDDTSSIGTLKVDVLDSGGATLCTVNPPASTSPSNSYSVALPAGCLNTLARVNGVQLRFTGAMALPWYVFGSRTFKLDGIELSVTYAAPRSLTLGTLSPQIPDAANATIDSALLTIVHSESAAANQQVVITPGGGGAACAAVPLTQRLSLAIDTINVKLSGCLDTATKLNGATVVYQASTNSGTVTTAVDGISIAVAYTDVATRTVTLRNPFPAVAGGASIDSAVLTVAHRETGNASNPRLVITPGGGGTCTITLTPSPTLTSGDTFDVKASGCLNTAAKLNGAVVQYAVNLTDSGAAQTASVALDGVTIAVGSTDTTTHGVTLSSLSPTVSGASTLDSALLYVAHQETGASVSPRLVITPGGAAACATIALPTHATLITDTIDVKASGCLNTAAKLNGAKIQYLVNLTDTGSPQNAIASLDGMRIDVGTTDTATRTLTLSNGLPPLPGSASTVVDSALLSIAHQETGAGVNPRLVITPNGSAACAPIALPTRATLITDTIDVTSCLNNVGKVNGATFAYLVNLTATGSAQSAIASVDGVNIGFGATDTSNKQITLSGFGPAIPTSVGSLTSVTVNVAHSESAGTNPRIVVTAGGGGTQTYPLPVRTGSVVTDTVDVSGFLTTPDKINGAQVQFLVNVTGGPVTATAALDGITIGASYTPVPDRAPDLPTVTCDDTQSGVQWVFGGDSRIYMPDGVAQLCAGPSPNPSFTKQQIAVYGIPPLQPLRSTGVLNQGAYSNPGGAKQIGDVFQDGTGTVTGKNTANVHLGLFDSSKPITVGPFGPAPAIPAGMHVAKVQARINHWEENSWIFGNPTIEFTNGQNQSCGSQTLTLNGSWNNNSQFGPALDTEDVTGCFTGSPAVSIAKLGGAGKVVDVSAKFTAYPVVDRTEHFDGAELVVTLEPDSPTAAVYAPENGCVAGILSYPNYWDGISDPDCALWKWDSIGPNQGDQKAQVSMHGTFYAPGGVVDLDDQGARCAIGAYCYTGVNYPIFDRGLIVRHLRFKAFKIFPGYTSPVITCGGECGGKVPNPKRVHLVATVGSSTPVDAWVCFGPVVAGNCTGDGNGLPTIMSWNAK